LGKKNYRRCREEERVPIGKAALAEGILEVWPAAKILWLWRDPKKWIRSGMHAGWCETELEEVCGYYQTVNTSIMKLYDSLPDEKRGILKIEDLTPKRFRQLWDWFELAPWDDDVNEWTKKDFRGHLYHGPKWFRHPDDWTSDELDPFNKYISPLVEQLEERYAKDKFTR